ncbi:estradiol 17-beta-dehydrogenase, putative [Ixodes scapularis]|uniref:Estradiol 17-beta-dehydrogenase, putative n=1 Tax=Ixodes scapularis TaxID=6945 RepID=B7PUW1_IXOSC|nr:estradiol 17-beta-dehydrogenase, putative [Ixodes scapularis]|eukprot:XP_002406918.1 estradiol 17-beta-dehydrogenase, putative [Ixodes scapularis]
MCMRPYVQERARRDVVLHVFSAVCLLILWRCLPPDARFLLGWVGTILTFGALTLAVAWLLERFLPNPKLDPTGKAVLITDLWAVVCNAGVNLFLEFEWMSQRDVSWMFDVNVHGTVRVVRAFLPLLRRSRGRLVLVSSYAGKNAHPVR